MNIGAAEMIVLCMLVPNSICDIRKQEILLLPTVIFAAGGIVCAAVSARGASFVLCGLLPGALLGALSAVSRQAVGAGDAVVLTAAGVWCGFRAAFLTLLTALVMQAAVSLLYKAAGGCRRELAFVPALCGAYALVIFMLQT